MAKDLWLSHMTRDRVKEIAPATTLVLPTAAIEQHGPHLPLLTDTAIAQVMAERVAMAASELVPVCVAPVLPYGNSHHHLEYVALSLRSATYVSVLEDLLDCAVEAGFRRIFVLNAHGGNDESIKLASRNLVLRSQLSIAACSYWSVSKKAAQAAGVDDVGYFPGHAGGFETAIMKALAPQLVDEALIPQDEAHPVMLSHAGLVEGLSVFKHGEWRRVDGYSDTPAKATAEAGNRLFESIVAEVAKALIAFHQKT